MMRGLNGRVVLIGGGATGIGAAVARRAAAEGATVVVADLFGDRAKRTAAGIVEGGGRAEAVEFDISDAASVRAPVAGVVDRYGRIDGLHANAADISPHT